MRLLSVAVLWIAALPVSAAGIDFDRIHLPPGSAVRDRILTTGEFHGDEVKAQDASRWMGLFANPNGSYSLRPVTIRVQAALDPVLGDYTGKRVTTSEKAEPVFLVNMALGLRSRTIPTFFHGSLPFDGDGRVEFHWQGRRIIAGTQPNGKTLAFEDQKHPIHQMYLEQGEERFPLPIELAPGIVGGATLLWAGDLDGDGKPDFLFEETGYNWVARRLFLSTAAVDGLPVGEVAFHYTTGC